MQREEPDLSGPRPFIVCANCGQLIPSHAPTCEYCGAASPFAEQIGEQKILSDIFNRAAPISPTLIGINVAIYVLITIAAGGDLWRALTGGADTFTLLAFGAQNNELLQNGQWFRLITPAFVHIGLLHLIMNSYALWTIGPLVEKLYGSARFLAIYLLTAAGGCLASYLNHARQHDVIGVSAGASGAIFGLFGVIAVFSYRYRNELPQRFLKALKSSVLPVIGLNLLIGFSLKYIDNAAHIGGLLTGAALALVVPYISTNTTRRVSRLGLALLAGCVLVIVTSFALAYRQSPPLLAIRLSKIQPVLDSIDLADTAIINVLRQSTEKPGRTPSAQETAQLSAAAETLEKTSSPDETLETIRLELIRQVRQQEEIIAQSNSSTFEQRIQSSVENFLKVQQMYKNWIQTQGKKYGFELKETPNPANKT